jgi:cell shape-determining protein MreD
MKKIWQYFFYALLVLILVFLQLGFVNTLAYGFNRINLVLLTLILLLFFSNVRVSLGVMLAVGFLLDLFSFNFFGIYMIALAATVVLADSLLANFFTNRSTYSFLALTFITGVAYNFFLYFLIYLTKFLEERTFFLFSGSFWLGLVIELAWSLGAIMLFFAVMGLTTNRLKPVFLDKK